MKLLISGSIIAAALVTTLLLFLRDQKGSGFSRRFIQPAPHLLKSNEVKSAPKPRQIIWAKDSQLLYATDRPDVVSKIALPNGHIQQIKADDAFFCNAPSGNIHQLTDGTNIYFLKINSPVFLKYNIQGGINITTPIPTLSFSTAIFMDDSELVVRRFDGGLKDQLFTKINIARHIITNDEELTERGGDWGTVTDGILIYDHITRQLVYIYHYSNKILLINDSLQIIRKGTTIDTNASLLASTAVHAASKKEAIVTSANYQPVINRIATADAGIIYIVSGIKADNESSKDFRDNYVVDCYGENEIKYLGSFYLPRYRSEQDILDISVKDSNLFVLYTGSLHHYGISPSVFTTQH